MTVRLTFEMYITGWRRLIGSPKLQIIFHKRATKYRALLRKMNNKDKGSYESSPPCRWYALFENANHQRYWMYYIKCVAILNFLSNDCELTFELLYQMTRARPLQAKCRKAGIFQFVFKFMSIFLYLYSYYYSYSYLYLYLYSYYYSHLYLYLYSCSYLYLFSHMPTHTYICTFLRFSPEYVVLF